MAITYTHADAINAARTQFQRELDPAMVEYIVNMAINKMWNAYDWRGSVVELPPFWLVPMQQDYGSPLYTIPTNFMGLREVYLVNVQTQNSARGKIQVTENIEATSILGPPTSICYRAAISAFRVWPRPSSGMACPQWLIEGTYKKRPTKFTRTEFDALLPWDDTYFQCFVQALGWAGLVASGRRDEAMKQEMIFKQILAETAAVENQELGEPIVHPTESLLMPRSVDLGGWF